MRDGLNVVVSAESDERKTEQARVVLAQPRAALHQRNCESVTRGNMIIFGERADE